MRDIKFRVWDKEYDLMYEDVGIIGNRLILEYELDEDWEEIDQTCYVDIDETNEEYFKIMQYTGIKDINGKEIYDGDVIQDITDGVKGIKGVISWSDAKLMYLFENKSLRIGLELCRLYGPELEIIGNIYENPGLLEQ